MSVLFSALISFLSIAMIVSYLSPSAMRRVAGYAMIVDIVLQVGILWIFFGTSTLGLLQAECAGILFSLGLRAYRWAFGYERLVRFRWVRVPGVITRIAR